MSTNRQTARRAGLWYLIYLIATIAANALGRSGLIVYGDAAATAHNITASGWLFRVGFLSDVLAAVFFLVTAWALYALLKTVNQDLALLFLLLNLGGVAVQCFSMLMLFSSTLLLSGADYLNVFRADQLQALAMLFLYLYKYGFVIAQIFFGTWLLPLGYLVFKSGTLPRALGILLLVDFVGEMIWFFQAFLFPSYEVITYPGWAISFLAEIGLTLWLLLKGAKDQQPAPSLAH